MKRSSPLDTTNDHHYATSEEACGCGGFFSHCKNGGNLAKKPNTAAAASGVAMINATTTENWSFQHRLNTAKILFEASNSTNSKNIHGLVAREMNKMTIEERNQVYDDVHGVSQPVSEDEESIAQKLCEFEAEILNQTRRREIADTMNQHYRRALSSYASVYMQAEEQSKEFVEDRKRRLSFLRADNFDAKKAAVRFMKYLEAKLNLFGAEKLTKQITLEDLDEDDKAHLESGLVQILPARDRAGRALIFSNHHDMVGIKAKNFVRVVSKDGLIEPQYLQGVHGGVVLLIRMSLFMMSVLAGDEETQKNGIVIINFCVGKRIEVDQGMRELFWHGSQFTTFMPLRVAGIQICCDNAMAATVLPLLMLAVGSHSRARFRFHKGTLTEAKFGLMTFGIPVHTLPVGNEGETKLGNHKKWVERQRKLDGTRRSGDDPSCIGIYLPSRFDVLLGRGKPIQEHPGNQRFRYLIATHKDQYANAKKRNEKTMLAESIVEMVKSSSGRFLERADENGWREVTDLVAREKVSHAFRATKA